MITLFIGVFLVVTLYLYSTKNVHYWKNKGVKHDMPLPLIGNHGKVYFMKKSWAQHLSDIYAKYSSEAVIGYFHGSSPALIIRDLEIIKRVLVSDFSHFYLRSFIPFNPAEPLLNNLFNADGDKWKLLRQRLTPAFTSGKLKAMFPLIVERAERLHTRIMETAGAPIDARDLMARLTTDFIGAVGFGLDMDALTDDDSEFLKLGRKIVRISFRESMMIFLKTMAPRIFKSFKSRGIVEKDVLSLVRSILKQRNYKPSGRHDFVDLLLECKEKGTIVGDSIEKYKPDGTPEKATMEMTEDIIAAQIFVFFVAGFETSSSTSSYTLHQLAFNPDKQKIVQDEIDKVLLKYDNKLCYDAIKEMHYLNWAFKESMRMFPSVGFLMRTCAHKYKIPELDLAIDEGVKVLIPVAAMQNDPQYFESPEQFRPERFSPEELNTEKTKFVYLPFGDGPRACIGERLGLMQSMAGLAAVLSRFTVEPGPTSLRHPVVLRSPSIIQQFANGLPLIFRVRKKCL